MTKRNSVALGKKPDHKTFFFCQRGAECGFQAIFWGRNGLLLVEDFSTLEALKERLRIHRLMCGVKGERGVSLSRRRPPRHGRGGAPSSRPNLHVLFFSSEQQAAQRWDKSMFFLGLFFFSALASDNFGPFSSPHITVTQSGCLPLERAPLRNARCYDWMAFQRGTQFKSAGRLAEQKEWNRLYRVLDEHLKPVSELDPKMVIYVINVHYSPSSKFFFLPVVVKRAAAFVSLAREGVSVDTVQCATNDRNCVSFWRD